VSSGNAFLSGNRGRRRRFPRSRRTVGVRVAAVVLLAGLVAWQAFWGEPDPPPVHEQGASALVRRAVDDAIALGVRRLYLYTPSTELFYSRLGWSLVERTRYRGTDVVVMSYECAA